MECSMFDQRAMSPERRMRAGQRGVSLVELMVAMAIGLLVVFVVTEAYVSATATQRSQSDRSRVQESMRFAFESLSYAVRKAGYRNPAASGPLMDDFCGSGKLRLVGKNAVAAFNPTTSDLTGTGQTVLNSSDIVRVRYHGDGTLPSTADGSVTDCLGATVAPDQVVEDTYWVAADPNNENEPSLFCYTTNSAGSGNVAIVPGIESIQILYGEDTTGDGVSDRLVPAGSVGAMNSVKSVVVSIVARSPSRTAIDATAQTFQHFDAGYTGTGDAGSTFIAPGDGRLRQMSGTTIALKNTCPM